MTSEDGLQRWLVRLGIVCTVFGIAGLIFVDGFERWVLLPLGLVLLASSIIRYGWLQVKEQAQDSAEHHPDRE